MLFLLVSQLGVLFRAGLCRPPLLDCAVVTQTGVDALLELE